MISGHNKAEQPFCILYRELFSSSFNIKITQVINVIDDIASCET